MRTIYRKCCRKVLAAGLCVSLIAVQSVVQYTEIVEASNEDFSDIFIGMDSVINQLLDFGLDIQEVETLLNVTPKIHPSSRKVLLNHHMMEHFK